MIPDDSEPLPSPTRSGSGDVGGSAPSRIADLQAGALFHAASPPRSARRGWEPPGVEELQRGLPQYRIDSLVGCGGMGAVYRGWQHSLDRQVAIKILPAEIHESDPAFAERFKREARAMARLSHPGIVGVHDAGETPEGLLYFVMDFVEGTDVQQLLGAEGRLPVHQALSIASSVCDALAYAHRQGVIHRDIKPSNVMVDSHGQVKVADFGLAKLANATETDMLTASALAMGTPDYMSPERVLGMAQMDHRADLYAVGVMLYQMLTGRLPRGRFAPPSRAVPGLDRRLDTIVDRALQHEPDARWSSAMDLRRALEPLLARSMARRQPATARARLAPWVIAGALLLLTGGGSWLWWSGRGRSAGESLPAAATTDKAPPGASGKDAPLHTGGALELDGLSKAEALKLAGVEPQATKATGAPYPSMNAERSVTYPVGVWTRRWPADVEAKRHAKKDGLWGLAYANLDSAASFSALPMTNVGLRVRFRGQRIKPDFFPQINLRSAGGGSTNLNVESSGKKLQLRLFPRGGAPVILAELALSERLSMGKEYAMEFYAIGSTLMGRLDGQTLTARSTDAPLAGTVGVHGGENDYLCDFEVLNLDGLPEAEALKLVGLPEHDVPAAGGATLVAGSFPAGRWLPLWPPAPELPDPAPEWSNRLRGVQEREGWFEVPSKSVVNLRDARASSAQGAVRATFRYGQDAKYFGQLEREFASAPQSCYRLRLSPDSTSVRLLRRDEATDTGRASETGLCERRLPQPLALGEAYTLELAAIGSRLIGRYNGTVVLELQDAQPTILTELYAGEAFRDVQVIKLDGKSEAEALRLVGMETP